MLSRQGLIEVKARALRRRIWFKFTSRLERGIVDLTIHCVERIRSPVLNRIIFDIVRKIVKTLENGFLSSVNKVGKVIAERVCGIAERWGNKNASSWKQDAGFIRFLGVTALNKHKNLGD